MSESEFQITSLTPNEKFTVWKLRNKEKYKEILEQMEMTPAYLGQLFKKEAISPWARNMLESLGIPAEMIPPVRTQKKNSRKKQIHDGGISENIGN